MLDARFGLFRPSSYVCLNFQPRWQELLRQATTAQLFNVNVKILKHGDLNYLEKKDIKFALNSDIYIVFGSSFIKKNWLINFLIKKKAINIHMGLSPFYRGSSCNFWAVKDKKPELVGSTIHYLSKGLDSGKIISHCLPDYKQKNCFNYI